MLIRNYICNPDEVLNLVGVLWISLFKNFINNNVMPSAFSPAIPCDRTLSRYIAFLYHHYLKSNSVLVHSN